MTRPMPLERDTPPGYLIPGDRMRLASGAVLDVERVWPTTIDGWPSIAIEGTEEVSGRHRTVCRPARSLVVADCPRAEPKIVPINPGLA